MLDKVVEKIESRDLAVKMYDLVVRDVQRDGPTQKNVFAPFKKITRDLSAADKVAAISMAELSTVSVSRLLHKLSMQLAADPYAKVFDKETIAQGCG